jgi:murein DD-endopeptidase MepM/ murein hydrolase activator NlpD
MASNYQVLIYGDGAADFKHVTLTKNKVRLLIAAGVFLVACFAALGVFIVREVSHQRNYQAILAENAKLQEANQRFHQAAIEIEDKLRRFDEKTNKLARYVGIEPNGVAHDGIGGAEVFADSELNAYISYDLGLLTTRTQQLGQRMDNLDEALQDHRDRLDTTPTLLPTSGWISSGFNYRRDPFTNQRTWHNGIDVSSLVGTPIVAPANGVVSFRGHQGGFGKMLELTHGEGLVTRYAHLSRYNVSKGQRVKRGEVIGYVGNTGRSTAPHLHYEVHKDGKAVNPMKYIFSESNGL